MCLAERVATGSRPHVLEDGPDTLNSDEDAEKDVEADVEKGMYTSETDPELGPKTLSPQEAAQQRAAAKALKEFTSSSRFTTSSSPDVSSDFGNSIVTSPQSTRQPTPLNSDNEDDMTEDHKRLINHSKKCSSIPRCSSAPGDRPPPKPATRQPASRQPAPAKEPKGHGTPVARMRDDAGPSQKVPEPQGLKAAAPPRAPAERTKSQGFERESSTGQESPEAKASSTQSQSPGRAGSPRGGVGSGLMGYVWDLWSPSPKPGS
jgi:hypothetical protein